MGELRGILHRVVQQIEESETEHALVRLDRRKCGAGANRYPLFPLGTKKLDTFLHQPFDIDRMAGGFAVIGLQVLAMSGQIQHGLQPLDRTPDPVIALFAIGRRIGIKDPKRLVRRIDDSHRGKNFVADHVQQTLALDPHFPFHASFLPRSFSNGFGDEFVPLSAMSAQEKA